MCGTYYIDEDTLNEIEKTIDEIDQRLNRKKWNQDIRPTDSAPVITGENNRKKLQLQRFGYSARENSGLIINARAETVLDRPMFQSGIRCRRLVVPARHFYEWNAAKEKNTFSRGDGESLYLAGIYTLTDDIPRFVILTTQANASMKPVHDRMPLILEKQQVDEWLFSQKCAEEILQQTPIQLTRYAQYEQMTLPL